MSPPQATLCYILKAGRVLLIHKKRGIGAGKMNGPGGKVDDGESPLAAAIRETQEEIGVTPICPELRGELWFHFESGHVLHCFVFLALDCEGPLQETAEAIPEWFDADKLPFERMWDDDRLWLPHLLSGKRFRGEVNIEGKRATTTSFTIIN